MQAGSDLFIRRVWGGCTVYTAETTARGAAPTTRLTRPPHAPGAQVTRPRGNDTNCASTRSRQRRCSQAGKQMAARSSRNVGAAVEYEFATGQLGIRFTTADAGMPVRIDTVVPGSQAEQMGGLEPGVALFAVNGAAVGERTHAQVVAMIKAALGAAATAQPAGSAPVRLGFLTEAELEKVVPEPEPEPARTVATTAAAKTEALRLVPAQALEPGLATGTVMTDWVAQLAGEWEATGQLTGQTDVVETEWLLLEVSSSGQLSGLVDDGDGVIGADDCRIENSHCTVENDVYHVAFDQIYSDGAVTRWECVYCQERDMLVAGRWEGDVSGTFQAQRRQRNESSDASSDASDDDKLGMNAAVVQAIAAGAERVSRLQAHSAHNDSLTPVRRMSASPQATSPFAAARDELESLTRGAASLFSDAERDLEESAARVADLEAMVEQRDAELRKLKQILAGKDATIREKEEQLQQKEQRLTKLSTALQALTLDGMP